MSLLSSYINAFSLFLLSFSSYNTPYNIMVIIFFFKPFFNSFSYILKATFILSIISLMS